MNRRKSVSENSTTPFSNRCQILADLWMNFRDDEEFLDFVEYNDLGLPLAYAMSSNIVTKLSVAGEDLINETWDLFLAGLEVEDTGFEHIDDVLGY